MIHLILIQQVPENQEAAYLNKLKLKAKKKSEIKEPVVSQMNNDQ